MYITVGKRAAQFVARTRRQLVAEFTITDSPRFAEARPIATFARDLFLKGEVDQVQIVATRFINTMTQHRSWWSFCRSVRSKGLALPGAEFGKELAAECNDVVFEPSAGGSSFLSARPLSQHFLFRVLLEAKASEQSARMVAMTNATDNADSADQRFDTGIQQAASGQYHEGTTRNRRRTTREQLTLCQRNQARK